MNMRKGCRVFAMQGDVLDLAAGSVIGGNVWLTHSVPPGAVVTHGATVERPRVADEPLLEYNI